MTTWTKWLLGVFAALLVSGAGTGAVKLMTNGEKIAALEMSAVKTDARLERIENKIDRLLERPVPPDR